MTSTDQATPIHLHTGFGVDGTAVCDEPITDDTRTATSIDKVTCTSCRAAYEQYVADLTAELNRWSRGG
ncbi:hypothetical protein [Verrucosispora sp. WMMC514]|uniref:hypothetical protein n=1 Tax=Verrucosispora sp. WMMC514 TaxID=3015156 RepID=UPI00248B6CDA|nr:hypothetical protein [Verrucosispora sp. WMMC514]WBB94135.1 hypothetical protein O7597_14900 [Verrucosispora sp. WMMC514]